MSFCWPLGRLGWSVAALFGVPVTIKVDICYDPESKLYYATSSALGLAVEGDSLDALVKEIHDALPVLLATDFPKMGRTQPRTRTILHANLAIA